MIDQYNMDQYNKETSQIHAPADLIRRTKEAVREEEQRIARERLQQNTVVQTKRSYGKVYRWALPVAAAVLCVMLLNISGLMLGRSKGGAWSGSTMDMASGAAPSSDSGMGAQSGAADMSESAAADATAADGSANNGGEYNMVTEAEIVEEEHVSEDYDGRQPADAAASAESDASADSSVENGIREESEPTKAESSYIESIYRSDLWIEEVKEIPTFYGNPDTECVTIQGIELYVGKDFDGAWVAYAEIDGSKYIISTELTEEKINREEFARAAYEMLMEFFS